MCTFSFILGSTLRPTSPVSLVIDLLQEPLVLLLQRDPISENIDCLLALLLDFILLSLPIVFLVAIATVSVRVAIRAETEFDVQVAEVLLMLLAGGALGGAPSQRELVCFSDIRTDLGLINNLFNLL